jgi:ubiquinone/menaquinone biosynthesis C-methylase UbiE
MRRLPSLLLIAGLLTDLRAEAPPADPPGFYLGRPIAQTMHWTGAAWLIRHEREREEAASKLLADLPVGPGQVVCDLGCGNGYYTLPLARRVAPGGKVLAVEIQPRMLELLRERAEKEGVTGIEPILGTEDDPKLPPASCDLILLVDTYHEFSAPVAMLRHIRTALKEDGLLALVEYRAEDDQVPIKPEHKMSKAQILKEMTANGFALRRAFDELPWQHVMYFGKAPAP